MDFVDQKEAAQLFHKYGLSQFGFLPKCCVVAPEFKAFEEILSRSNCDSVATRYRQCCELLTKDDMPRSQKRALDEAEVAATYSVLCMAVNFFLWTDAQPGILPLHIAAPLLQCANFLGLPPIVTHAALDLYNWEMASPQRCVKILYKGTKSRPTLPSDQELHASMTKLLGALSVRRLFTGQSSEEWFYKLMIAIEATGGPALHVIPYVCREFGRPENVRAMLRVVQLALRRAVNLIRRMRTEVEPTFFFNTLRKYLSGSVKLPMGGLDFAGMLVRRDVGGSAAQSSLLQVYDVFLGVEHFPEHGKEFLLEMRNYMPAKHRAFIELVERLPSLRNYVHKSDCEALVEEYNACVDQLAHFRRVHLGLIHSHIAQQDASNPNNVHDTHGSGGTDPVPFGEAMLHDTSDVRLVEKKKTRACCWLCGHKKSKDD